MFGEAAFALSGRPPLPILEHEGVRSPVADCPRHLRCGAGDIALGVPALRRPGPGRADTVVSRDRRGCRTRSCGSPGSRCQAHFGASPQGRLLRAARRDAARACRAAPATSSDQGAQGTPPRSEGGRRARTLRSPAGGNTGHARGAGHDAAALQQRDDGNEQGARPRPRPCAEVDCRRAGAPCARSRKGIRALERAPPRTPTRTREEGADRAIVCAHYASEGERRWERPQGGQEIGRAASGRLRLAAGLLLLALPLAVAVWTFGGLAAKRERNNADQELVRDLNSGASVYARHLRDARRTADRLARTRRVARAFAQSDERALRAIEQGHPWIMLARGSAGGLHGRKVSARVDVIGGERTIGRVFVVPPFGRPLVRTIADEAGLSDGGLGFVVDHRLIREDGVGRVRSRPKAGKAADLRMQGLEYRAVALPLGEQRAAPALITVRKRSEIAAAANDVRWRVIGLGLGLIGAFLVTAYAVAPAIARTRLSRLQRDQAQRVLARLGDGVFVVDHDGVVQALEPGCRGDHGPPGRGGARPSCGGSDSGLDDDRDVRACGGSTRGDGRPFECGDRPGRGGRPRALALDRGRGARQRHGLRSSRLSFISGENP